MGSDMFCIKICDPAGANPGGFCQNRLDRLGCGYNAPSRFTIGDGGSDLDGIFESCDSDDMDIPGEYVVDGVTHSFAQPPESAGPISTVPYVPRLPRSSNCVSVASAVLYTDLPGHTPRPRAEMETETSSSRFVTSRMAVERALGSAAATMAAAALVPSATPSNVR
jgi:hypothetical protein